MHSFLNHPTYVRWVGREHIVINLCGAEKCSKLWAGVSVFCSDMAKREWNEEWDEEEHDWYEWKKKVGNWKPPYEDATSDEGQGTSSSCHQD